MLLSLLLLLLLTCIWHLLIQACGVSLSLSLVWTYAPLIKFDFLYLPSASRQLRRLPLSLSALVCVCLCIYYCMHFSCVYLLPLSQVARCSCASSSFPFPFHFNLLPLCFCSNMRLSDVRLIGCQFILFARNCSASNNNNNKRPSKQATKQKLGNMLRSHTQFQLQLQLLSTSQSPSPSQSLLKLLSLLTGYRLRLRCCDYSCCSSLPAN